MSTNNNPNGHLNQAQAQNPTSWNPLQIEHQMNPLLPPYMRNSTIFDSMDLSLQSARATTSPLNKGAVMSMPIAPQLDFGIKTPTTTEEVDQTLLQQQSLFTQTANNYPMHNLSINSTSPQQQQEHQQVTNTTTSPNIQTTSSRYLNVNGINDYERSSMLPPTTVATTNTNNNGHSKNINSNPSSCAPSPVHYMRSDANLVPRLNENFPKMDEMLRMSFDGEYPTKSVQKSEELITKESHFNKMLQPETLLSPKKQSPQQQQQQKTPPQLSVYQNQGNSDNDNGSSRRNGSNTPPNESLTASSAMEFFKQAPIRPTAQQQNQQNNIYQSHQQQNASPLNSQLLNNLALHPTTDNAMHARSPNSSSSSSSSDDDEDDDSVDSSNSSHSQQSCNKSVEKSSFSKKEMDNPQTTTSSQRSASPQTHRSPFPAKESDNSGQENGLKNKEFNENSNESLRNKICDFSQQIFDSPKTKKQKQALKIRNAEQTNSNSNSSLLNETKIEVLKVATLLTNDSGGVANNLCEEHTAYSPRSNSHSRNSSSSSSICSHSSRFGNENKTHKKEKQTTTLEDNRKNEKIIKEKSENLVTVKNQGNEENAQKALLKSNTFEEVENKLEEMFAGIEDEEPQEAAEQERLIGTAPVADINLALQLANNSPTIVETDTKSKNTKLPAPNMQPMATKASKKSTPPTPTQINAPASKFCSQPMDSTAKETLAAFELPSTSIKAMEIVASAEIKETMNKAKNQTGKTTRRRAGKKSANKNATAKNNAKQKRQQKSNRRRRNSTEEEDSNSAKEPTNFSSVATDVKYRSPFVLVKSDGSVSVINAPTAEDAGSEKLGGKNKKIPAAKYAHERNRIRGLHSSTLSNKYDADTTDNTWICVFCKRGPHKEGLGDLFGPYLVSIDCNEYRTALKLPGAIDMDALFAEKRRRIDMVQTHTRNIPIVPAMHVKHQAQTSPGRIKKKRKSNTETEETLNTSTSNIEFIDAESNANIFLGMSKVSENSYEVWIHEDCVVWAPDVHLVGSRVTGLDATVWNSTRYNCEICAKSGATLCCLERGCNTTAHSPCARQACWNLNEAQMKVYCRRHVEQKCKQMGMLSNALFFLNAIQNVTSSGIPNS